jgi:cell division protein FtsI (penicillin-binding protein 3)
VAVTPIQLIRAVSAIANGGWLVTPRVVKGVRSPNGEVQTFRPALSQRAISEETAFQMGEILKTVTEKEGTGHLAAVPGYRVGGKTGTAQKVDPATGRYSSDKFISSFVGYIPADRPEIAILVIVDSPTGVAWGGSVAAPVFSRIAEQTLRYLHVPPAEGENPLLVARNP